MNSTSKIESVRRLGGYLSIAVAALLLPGIAGADELMLSEITVVALAIDTQSIQSETRESAFEDALERVREQIRSDTDAHVRQSVELPVPKAAETVAYLSRG